MDLKDVGISQFWKVKGQVQAAAGSAFVNDLSVMSCN